MGLRIYFLKVWSTRNSIVRGCLLSRVLERKGIKQCWNIEKRISNWGAFSPFFWHYNPWKFGANPSSQNQMALKKNQKHRKRSFILMRTVQYKSDCQKIIQGSPFNLINDSPRFVYARSKQLMGKHDSGSVGQSLKACFKSFTGEESTLNFRNSD